MTVSEAASTQYGENLLEEMPSQKSDKSIKTWRDALHGEREKAYFRELLEFVDEERAAGNRIYPSKDQVFAALSHTPLERVRVVILGQDPYHGPGQAHGLCFSVQPGVPFPPSLNNIFKELRADIGLSIPASGCLVPWAHQGVLLLNAVLTVEEGKPNSHANKGWEKFTDKVIEAVVQHRSGVVFLLWGAYAQRKGEQIIKSQKDHLILKAPHPSPLSASRGFFGCRHFSKSNEFLVARGGEAIDWGGSIVG
jgi:uracil-DNA glycosylase